MLEAIERIRENIARVYFGNPDAIDRLLACVLARGHALIEDVPGVGKTLLASGLARSLGGTFSRIQLTPDLLPSDLLGVSIYDRETGRFDFKRGPIFANIVLADEINRTPPRTQAAMLEAMSESAVTIDGLRHRLGPPFSVIATQNPYRFEGTYTLPENELDRFLIKTSLGYAPPDSEARVLEQRPASTVLDSLEPVISSEEVVRLQNRTDEIRVDRSLIEYVIEIARVTRESPDVWLGLSTRGTLALTQLARATALLAGRDYAIPEDIIGNVLPVCGHRVLLREDLASAGGTGGDSDAATRQYLTDLLESTAAPA
ncbi:MAG: MoxR family ATPase [Planctomycetota bacterium]